MDDRDVAPGPRITFDHVNGLVQELAQARAAELERRLLTEDHFIDRDGYHTIVYRAPSWRQPIKRLRLLRARRRARLRLP